MEVVIDENLAIRIENFRCDKCQTDVPMENDAVALEAFLSADLTGRPYMDVLSSPYQRRHLLPVTDHEGVLCEGSPSRVQYLENQPRDTRLGAAYHEDLEEPIRRAFARLKLFAKEG